MRRDLETVGGIAPEALDLLGDGAVGIPEAVAFAGVSRPELYRRMADGRLAFVKIGRRRLIPRRALVRFLAAGLSGGVDAGR